MESVHLQNVTLPLKEYNQLYEQAFFNERLAELEKQRSALQEEKRRQDEAFKEKEKRFNESRTRGEKEQRGAVTSHNWLLTQHTVEGAHDASTVLQDSSAAVFNFALELRVFEPEWTTVPIVDSQIITDSWMVQRVDMDQIPTGGAEPAWKQVSLGSDTMMIVQELDGMPGRQVLATSIPGLYRITFSAYAFVHSSRNLHSLSLSLLHPITVAQLKLKQGADARTRLQELNITPAARYSVAEADGAFDISMRLPPTKTLEVKWRSIDVSDTDWERMNLDGAAEQVVAEEEPLQIIAVHDALHSIMDGVLQSSHTLKFSVDSEQRTLTNVRFTVHDSARVTSVTGHGVMSWKSSPTVSSNAGSESITTVEVSFKTSLISDTIIVLLNTEMELSTGSFSMPSVVCEGVLRQTGNLAVVKMANVEVYEEEARGIARVGVDELPAELKCQTNLPIMFAYKYLSPQSKVHLCIVKHEQVDVLEAVAETAFYEVLMSDGQSMHRLMLNMQNSRKQYVEVRGIPQDARLWSLIVNSKPAKPVRGADGNLLIPLLVGAKGNSNEGAQSTSVELAYLRSDPLGDAGVTDLTPPRLDIPISTLLVEVQWPASHNVKFKGSPQAVQGFSHSLPRPVNHDVGTDMVPSGFDFNRAPAHIPKKGVNVQVPRAGQVYRFQQLLVIDAGAAFTAEYQAKDVEEEKPETWSAQLVKRLCARRR
jgi:hypothetical protein